MKKAQAIVVFALLGAGCASNPPAPPAQNVNAHRHPNLAAAQRDCGLAFDKLTNAQQANEWDMGGHAKRAKELLSQAADEIKQAALSSNHH
jgi:hypothetical protein